MVGTFAWNHAPHVELYYGISGIGAICHTINRLTNDQTEYIINNSEDKVIFVDATSHY
jgi:fatty-acyl-CoA synthase